MPNCGALSPNPAGEVSQLTKDSTLVAVYRSGGSGDVFLDDIKRHDDRRGIAGFRNKIADSKQDLPRHQAGKDRRRKGRGEEGVSREEAPNGVAERLTGSGGDGSGGRESEEIGEIGRDSGRPASPLERPGYPVDLHHD